MNWNKLRGEHPVFNCNLCKRSFTIGGFAHDRFVMPSVPGLGTMSLVVCTSACRKKVEKVPQNIIEAHFKNIQSEAIEHYKNRDLSEELKEFENIMKSAAENIGLKLVDVTDN